LDLTPIDTDEVSDLRDRESTTTHLLDQRVQPAKVTGPASYGISAYVLRSLVEALTLPCIDSSDPVQRCSDRLGISGIGEITPSHVLALLALPFNHAVPGL